MEENTLLGGGADVKDIKDMKEVKHKAKEMKDTKDKVIKSNDKKKPKKKKGKELKFHTYICRVLKQVHRDCGITKHAMSVMNDLVCNAFQQISDEAGKLVKQNKMDTLTARDINCAVRLILPGELAQHSNDEGEAALKHYEQFNKNKQRL